MSRAGWVRGRAIAGVMLAAAIGLVAAAFLRGGWGEDVELRGLPPERRALVEKIDAALGRSVRWLGTQQNSAGAFPSGTYGVLKNGVTLTPHVLVALGELPLRMRTPLGEARQRGMAYLAGLAPGLPADGSVPHPVGLPYPAYTAAESVVALGGMGNAKQPGQEGWLRLLRALQLTEANGWSPGDAEYGGWCYALTLPTKPAAAEGEFRDTLLESNITSTVYAVEALRAAGVGTDDPAIAAAARFAERCQNFAGDPARATALDDGGFYFGPLDPLKNKAGEVGEDAEHRKRFRSYGTMTADGLRLLLLCGYKLDHPRVVAARRWMERNFDANRQPGAFPEDRELFRYGMYYYYAHSVARTLALVGEMGGSEEIATEKGSVRWAEALATRLVHIQNARGTWENGYTDSKEDDPLVATPLAVGALVKCRERIVAGR